MRSSSSRYYDAEYYTPDQPYGAPPSPYGASPSPYGAPPSPYITPHEEIYYGYDERGDYFAAPRRQRKSRRRAKKSHGFRNFMLTLVLLFVCVLAAKHYGGSPLSLMGLSLFGQGDTPGTANVENNYVLDLAALDSQLSALSGDYYPSDEEWGYLRRAEEENPELAEKLQLFNRHINVFSRGAVITLMLSPEKIDYVLQDPLYVGTEGAGSRELDVKKGKIPLLVQYDSRWGNHIYGSGGMGNTGCGPTCLSMVAAGLTGDGSLSPDAVADFAGSNGYYVDGTGTSWSLFTDGAAHFGLSGRELPLSEDSLRQVLKDGGAVILSVTQGDFTMGGHFIVVSGYSKGGFIVCDPSSVERSGEVWDADTLLSQTAAAWGLTRA